jgi:hypothetical protein
LVGLLRKSAAAYTGASAGRQGARVSEPVFEQDGMALERAPIRRGVEGANHPPVPEDIKGARQSDLADLRVGHLLRHTRRGGQANMSRLGALTAVAFFAAITSVRADEQVWTMESWPGDIDLIPCTAWSKTADGTWVLNGAVKLGSETMSNIGVKGDAAAHKLDRECGAKKK